MAGNKKNRKIVPYKRPININVGMIIFLIIFIYMSFSVYSYLNRKKIQFYEVVEGSIVNNTEYTGIILRDETVQYTDKSGYVNYYVREGKRAAAGAKIYSIDETGSTASFLAQNNSDTTSLTDENLSDIKKQLSSYSLGYDNNYFRNVYDTKYSVEAAVLEYVNFNTLDNVEDILSQNNINFTQVQTPVSGVISYAIDSYENTTADTISSSLFDRTSYSKGITKSGQLVESGSPIYKIINSDSWSVVFPLNENDIAAYSDASTLRVEFKAHSLNATGNFSIITGTDGSKYGKLDFNKYMIQFVSDRYVDFEIKTDKVTGLKIPVSSVTTKEFYLIPNEYITQGGDSSSDGVYKEVYSESGTSVIFVPTVIYYSTDTDSYIEINDDGDIHAGDYVVKPNSTERYQVGASALLQGAYSINKGYAIFKQIEVLSTNDEYYTIRKSMSYGLSVYDHIVLDADTTYEGALIYQ